MKQDAVQGNTKKPMRTTNHVGSKDYVHKPQKVEKTMKPNMPHEAPVQKPKKISDVHTEMNK